MAKTASTFELVLDPRPRGQTREEWLCAQLRSAILLGRLKAGVRLPASREFAQLYDLSRGIVVRSFERLQDEGYLCSRVGLGTWVNAKVRREASMQRVSSRRAAYVRRVVAEYKPPHPIVENVD